MRSALVAATIAAALVHVAVTSAPARAQEAAAAPHPPDQILLKDYRPVAIHKVPVVLEQDLVGRMRRGRGLLRAGGRARDGDVHERGRGGGTSASHVRSSRPAGAGSRTNGSRPHHSRAAARYVSAVQQRGRLDVLVRIVRRPRPAAEHEGPGAGRETRHRAARTR